eukprot:SAG31_NODE_30778_length_376_cov_0.747292_1_plen_91_part_10
MLHLLQFLLLLLVMVEAETHSSRRHREAPPAGDGFLNARDFGAVGDAHRCGDEWCGTDDAGALQAAITAAQTANRPLLLPSATYLINSTLV